MYFYFADPASMLFQMVLNWLVATHVWPLNDANLTGGLLSLLRATR